MGLISGLSGVQFVLSMLFTSFDFLVLWVATFALYWLVKPTSPHAKGAQITILLLASTLFYGWDNPSLLWLLAISCLGNTLYTVRIIQHKSAGNLVGVTRNVRWAVILNLSLLGVFKYSGFIASQLPFFPPGFVQYLRDIPLPIGISFYTFHGISMIIDVARGKVSEQACGKMVEPSRWKYLKAFRDIGVYILFFPQLIAGPIVKAHFFWPQMVPKFFADIKWGSAVRCLIIGFFLKMVLADNLAAVTKVLVSAKFLTNADALRLICSLFGYSMQIFADYAGYSIIAIGLAYTFGYNFPTNFNFPYLSTSMTEFWTRWNMTLSSWLKEYLYFPLGGNRKGELRTYFNLFMVMFLGGLWHGADWKFAVWGGLHGMFLIAERFLHRNVPKDSPVGKTKKILGWIYCFIVVTLLRLTFLMPDVATIKLYLVQVCTKLPESDYKSLLGADNITCLCYGGLVMVFHAFGWWREHKNPQYLKARNTWIEGVLYGIMLILIVTNYGPQGEFIYFQF